MNAVPSSRHRLLPFCQSSFERWWDVDGEWVEQPNVRRGGQSGVMRLAALSGTGPRLYCKRQLGHTCRSLLHPLGRPTVLREEQALKACERLGVPVPTRVFCAARRQAGQWQALLVTEELLGYVDLARWYAEPLADSQRHAVLQQLARVLRRLHRGRRQHGCLYAKHIFVRMNGEQAEVALLDLEKSRRRLLRSKAVGHDLDQLHRHRGGMPDADWRYLLACYRGLAVERADFRHGA